jgi:hypothetical protein
MEMVAQEAISQGIGNRRDVLGVKPEEAGVVARLEKYSPTVHGAVEDVALEPYCKGVCLRIANNLQKSVLERLWFTVAVFKDLTGSGMIWGVLGASKNLSGLGSG